MKDFVRDNLSFSMCGLNCGLCPMKLDKYCPGCGGGEGNQSCKIAKCSIRHSRVEYCNQCEEFPCEKYEGAGEYDTFITHRNWKRDFDKMKEIGVEAYHLEQGRKLEILKFLLEYYNDGRRKSFFCLAVNLLGLEELKNILDEKFNPEEANSVWCSDITYIWTDAGFVYLTSIMDLFSRKIIAWVLSDSLEAKHVVEAIEKAKKKRNVKKPKVMHADRGIQYTCNAYQEATQGWIRSYSKKAYPWDNACIESFHALIKREWINRFKIIDYNHAYTLIFEYIETFYNTVRIHSHCGYKSPTNYENEHLIKMEKEIKIAS